MKPRGVRVEARGVGFRERSKAVSTLRRDREGALISKQHQQVNKRKAGRWWIANRILHVIGRGK